MKKNVGMAVYQLDHLQPHRQLDNQLQQDADLSYVEYMVLVDLYRVRRITS